jgi:hypothetical protein
MGKMLKEAVEALVKNGYFGLNAHELVELEIQAHNDAQGIKDVLGGNSTKLEKARDLHLQVAKKESNS